METLVGDIKDKEINISINAGAYTKFREREERWGRERKRGLVHVLVRSDTRSQDLIEIYS